MKKYSYHNESDKVTTLSQSELKHQDVSGTSSSLGGASVTVNEDSSAYISNDDRDTDDISDADYDNDMLDFFNELGNTFDSDGLEEFADFSDFLLKKFASVAIVDYEKLYCQLVLKISKADIPNSNDIIKNITKIYSNEINSLINEGHDIENAKHSAYKKILTRADQYLTEK